MSQLNTTVTDKLWQLAVSHSPRQLRMVESMYRKSKRCESLIAKDDLAGLAIELGSMLGAKVALPALAKRIYDQARAGDAVGLIKTAVSLHPVGALIVKVVSWFSSFFDNITTLPNLQAEAAQISPSDPRVPFLLGETDIAGRWLPKYEGNSIKGYDLEWRPDASRWPYYRLGSSFIEPPNVDYVAHDLNIYGSISPTGYSTMSSVAAINEQQRAVPDSESGFTGVPDWYAAEEAYIASTSFSDWHDVDRHPPTLTPLPEGYPPVCRGPSLPAPSDEPALKSTKPGASTQPAATRYSLSPLGGPKAWGSGLSI